jgi:hypothetical protein
MTKANECTCPSGDGSLRHPCPAHPASVELAGVAANLTFINGRPAMCGCQVEYSSGGGEYSDVIYVTLCAKHSGSAILDLVATNRIALTPEYEGQWHADLYLDREIPLAKAEGATPAEAVLALMSAERIDPEQGGVDQAGGDRWDALQSIMEWTAAENIPDDRKLCLIRNAARAALAQPSPVSEPLIYACKSLAQITSSDGSGHADIALAILRMAGVCDDERERLVNEWKAARAWKPSPAQAEQAEAERPEVVGYLSITGARLLREWGVTSIRREEFTPEACEPLMTVAQHERIVGALRARLQAAEDRADTLEHRMMGMMTRHFAEAWRNRDTQKALDGYLSAGIAQLEQERDAALARVAELEKQEPVATVAKVPGEDWNSLDFHRELQDMHPGTKLYAAPVAQAQPEETPGEILAAKLIETWVTKHGKPAPWSTAVEITALATNMPNDERDRLLALDDDVDAQAQHRVPEELRAICMLVAETGIKYGRGRHRAVASDECRAVVNAVLNADLSVGRACEYAGCCDKAHPGTSLCIAHHSKKAREQLLAAAPGKEVGHE